MTGEFRNGTLNVRAAAGDRRGMKEFQIRSHLVLLALVLAACSAPAASGDGGSGSDAGAGDAGAGSDAGATCGALGGAMSYDLDCSRSTGGFATEVAILLDDPAAPRVRIMGRGLHGHSSCDVVDHVVIAAPAGALADFDVPGEPLGNLGLDGWLEGPATALASTFCASDADRFDAATLRVTGRTEGGTIAVACGGTTLGYPPGLVVTCHHGLPPSFPDAIVMDMPTETIMQSWAWSDSAASVASVVGSVDVIAGNMGVDTTRTVPGWSLRFWSDGILPPGVIPAHYYSFSIGAASGVLTDLCFPPHTGGPPPTPPLPLILRVEGMGGAGPFSTEIYTEACYRTM